MSTTPVVSSAPRAAFGRFVKSLLVANGDVVAAHGYAMGQGVAYREVADILKAAIAPMSSDANALVATPVSFDFAEALRPATLLGRMVGTRRAPFNIRMLSVATGATATWTGEGLAKPVVKLDLDGGVTLPFNKVTSLSVFTNELVRSSAPGIESILTADAVRAAAQAIDVALTDPDNAGVGRPASITNGGTAIQSTGSDVAAVDHDLKLVIAAMTAANVDLSSAYWLLHPNTATHIGLLRGSGGAPAYPGLGPRGGRLLEMPVLCSAAIADSSSPTEHPIILISADELLVADDNQARIQVSEHASVELNDAPQNEGATTQPIISLWQNNLAGLMVERVLSWRMRHAAGCAYVTGVQF